MCLLCGWVSIEPRDIKELHCPHCRRYHYQQNQLGVQMVIQGLELLRPDLTFEQRIELVRDFLSRCSPPIPFAWPAANVVEIAPRPPISGGSAGNVGGVGDGPR